MLEILKANVLIAYQQLEQYQLDRYGRGVVSAITENLSQFSCFLSARSQIAFPR